jgi:lysophospholipase
MLAIRTDPFPRPLARVITSFLVGIGLGERYAPTKGPRDPERPFDENRGTSSPIRYAFEQNLSRLYPERWVGGPTNAWVKASLEASCRIARDPGRLKQSLTMLIPTEDAYAVPDELIGICRNLGEKCHARILTGARHEVFVEADRYREPALHAVFRSLKDPSENPVHQLK